MREPVYLDHNATTPVLPEALAAMMPFLAECFGNPSSPHQAGSVAKDAINAARREVAALVGAKPGEIVFTSGATESNHAAMRGALALRMGRRRIVVTAVEHPLVLLLAERLAREGCDVVTLPVGASGELDLNALARAVTPDTALVCAMWANNETGVVFPVERVAAIAHSRGALCHTDATQAAGRVPLNFAAAGVDLASFSGHKLGAPKGIGALFVRNGLKLPGHPPGHQERGLRGGTENVPGIVAFGAACNIAAASLAAEAAWLSTLRDRLESAVRHALPDARINGARERRLPNTSSITFSGLDAEAILAWLDRAGIMVSMGSACTSGGSEPSHVLLAMGLSRSDALATLRFSLGHTSVAADVERLIPILTGICRELAAEKVAA